MTDRLKPLLFPVAGAVLLGLGGLILVNLRPWSSSHSQQDSESLLDLLLMQSPPREASRSQEKRAPLPPPRAPWASPLQEVCPPLDVALRERLLRLQERLKDATAIQRIHPSNYGERYQVDAYGATVDPTPRVIVLHETVYGLGSALNTFSTHHEDDADQVSYHSLIGLEGRLVRVVDPRNRAFGAGNSAFNNQWVVTNPSVGGSINNFALHLSLETPLDGENDGPEHSGYTPSQYDTLALELAHWMQRFRIPATHITTHRYVDLGGERADPRSFNWQALALRLRALGLLCG